MSQLKFDLADISITSACRNTGGRVAQPAQRAGDEVDQMRQALVRGGKMG